MSRPTSIIVATRNRAAALARCLRALERQTAPFGFEVIVVDNGSSDATPSVLESAIGGRLNLQALFEGEPGASRARNRGIRAATGAIFVFLDDDAEPVPEWLEALLGVFDETDAAVVGGPILARFEREPPPWLAGILRVLSAQDFGALRRTIDRAPYPYGGNLAVRRDDFDRVGGFDETLGPRGDRFELGEDTDICERLHEHGRPIFYEPGAIVYHWVGEERFAPGYLRQRAFGTGRSDAKKARRRLSTLRFVTTVALKASKLSAHAPLWAIARMSGDRESLVLRERSMLVTLGFVREAFSAPRTSVRPDAPSLRTRAP